LTSRFDEYLKEEETIIWTGNPKKNEFNSTYVFICIIGGLILLTFASIWNIAVWSNNSPTFFRVFGILFLFIGAFGGIIHILLHKFRRSKKFYAISNKRIYIEYYSFGKRIKSYNIKSLPNPTLKNYSNGIGTIQINYEKPYSSKVFSFAIEYNWLDQYRKLEFIQNPRKVLNLIKELKK